MHIRPAASIAVVVVAATSPALGAGLAADWLCFCVMAQSTSPAVAAGSRGSSVQADTDFRQCLPAQEHSPQDLIEIAEAVDTLARSVLFGSYFRGLLEASEVRVCWDPGSVGRGYFEPETNVIALAPGLRSSEKTLILAHELRHVDQYRRGFVRSLEFDMEENVRRTYAVEADAQAFATYYAWTERSNDPTLWKAATQLLQYDDIAVAVEQSAQDGATPERIMLAGFSAWYASSWRLSQYRIAATDAYLDWLDETHAIRRYTRFPQDHFDRLCLMPDGGNYGCHQTSEIGSRFSSH